MAYIYNYLNKHLAVPSISTFPITDTHGNVAVAVAVLVAVAHLV